jgi:hypothetical protein
MQGTPVRPLTLGLAGGRLDRGALEDRLEPLKQPFLGLFARRLEKVYSRSHMV